MAAIPPATSAVVEAIYRAYEASRSTYRPRRIGVSKMGNACDRHIWYAFRWCLVEHIHGQRLRLFDRGNREEERFIADLRSIGCTVSECNPDTGRQWHATACEDWLGASIDAAAFGVPGSEKTWHAVSFKTHNNKSFSLLKKSGVRESHPEHYVQMVLEMELHGFPRALYLAVNKDNDELYSERVKADPIEATRLLERARRIVYAGKPPERIGGPDWYVCKFCHFYPICHGQQFPERNCRTCMHSTPMPECRWNCSIHGDIRKDCPDHQYIPELVPGKQVDVRGGRVVYEMQDGGEWVD